MTFEEAVAAPGRKVQVSGREVRDGKRVLMIYGLGPDGAKQLAADQVPEGDHATLVADLKARGLPVAETDFYCDFVWVGKADGIEVYDSSCKVLDTIGDGATLADGRVIPRSEIARVIAFAASDYVYRGVKAALQSGKEVDLVTEASMSAMGDPTYSRNELLMETGWTTTIGVAIAAWAGTGFDDRI